MRMKFAAIALYSSLAFAQGTLTDYKRAQSLQNFTVLNAPGPVHWIEETPHFWYTKQVHGGTRFMLVYAAKTTKGAAFDHDRLAAAINTAIGTKYTALTLPFAPTRAPARPAAALTFVENRQSIQFIEGNSQWKCTLTDYICAKSASISEGQADRRAPEDEEPGGPPQDGLAFPQVGTANNPCAQAPASSKSPDGKLEAVIQNFNVFLRSADGKSEALSTDGSEGNAYTMRSVAWSPDSQHLVAYKVRPGYDRQVHYIESSPTDQLQPKHTSITYRKPGDALDIATPSLFHISTKTQVDIDNALFPNPYSLTPPNWWRDSRAFTFEYNQRGHQLYRVIEVNAQSGKPRALIDEATNTFFYYNQLDATMSAGRRYRANIADGKEIIWASERDGWEHLYLYDGLTGKVKNQITKGDWLVRNVEWVDEANRQIWFAAGGVVPGQDPYFTQLYRINFDGTGLTALTESNATHATVFSKDHKYYVDTSSRVDLPTVSQLRRAADNKLLMDLEQADATGIRAPEVFVAKGRDGTTDIWGIIVRPTNFDPARKYPVIEQIYAGPQGSFVPKTFCVPGTQALAELGFIVLQIDGMGTSNRSKAFHDVAFKNLGDAGFPDRILWHRAAAAKYPSYDISRVGIYGTSAGGQSSLGGALFHPDFYKVVVTNSGCHDNRMDKIWWNEQWMSWPIGPQYAASSNVDNAYRLQGKVLILIPEMDSNVDPASSLQVVDALVKANKHFDMLFIPGQNHGTGVLANQHYLQDYFVHHLLGVEPPDWNRLSPLDASGGQ